MVCVSSSTTNIMFIIYEYKYMVNHIFVFLSLYLQLKRSVHVNVIDQDGPNIEFVLYLLFLSATLFY